MDKQYKCIFGTACPVSLRQRSGKEQTNYYLRSYLTPLRISPTSSEKNKTICYFMQRVLMRVDFSIWSESVSLLTHFSYLFIIWPGTVLATVEWQALKLSTNLSLAAMLDLIFTDYEFNFEISDPSCTLLIQGRKNLLPPPSYSELIRCKKEDKFLASFRILKWQPNSANPFFFSHSLVPLSTRLGGKDKMWQKELGLTCLLC